MSDRFLPIFLFCLPVYLSLILLIIVYFTSIHSSPVAHMRAHALVCGNMAPGSMPKTFSIQWQGLYDAENVSYTKCHTSQSTQRYLTDMQEMNWRAGIFGTIKMQCERCCTCTQNSNLSIRLFRENSLLQNYGVCDYIPGPFSSWVIQIALLYDIWRWICFHRHFTAVQIVFWRLLGTFFDCTRRDVIRRSLFEQLHEWNKLIQEHVFLSGLY